jgi:hypothetical protein
MVKKMQGTVVRGPVSKGGWNIMLKETGSYWSKWDWRKTKAEATKEMNRILKRHNK